MDVIDRRNLMGRVLAAMASGEAEIFKKIEVHSVTISGITNPGDIPDSVVYTINHNLGEVPDFVLLFSKVRYVPEHTTKTNYTVNFLMYGGFGVQYNSPSFQSGITVISQNYIRGDNGSGGTNGGTSGWINNITSTSIRLGGLRTWNSGITNGEYWCFIGKLKGIYEQGEQVVYPGL